MKILLDECVPWPIHTLLVGNECMTAQQRGWGGVKNGELLRRAEREFAVFITADQNLRYPQNMAGRVIAIVVLSTNKWRRIEAGASALRAAVEGAHPGELKYVDIP